MFERLCTLKLQKISYDTQAIEISYSSSCYALFGFYSMQRSFGYIIHIIVRHIPYDHNHRHFIYDE